VVCVESMIRAPQMVHVFRGPTAYRNSYCRRRDFRLIRQRPIRQDLLRDGVQPVAGNNVTANGCRWNLPPAIATVVVGSYTWY